MRVNSSLNESAVEVFDQLSPRAGELGVSLHTIGGAQVIDAGIHAKGSTECGLLLAQISLAGLATLSVDSSAQRDRVVVETEHPIAACLASQYAGWQIEHGEYFAMGSGPMRAAYGREKLFDVIGHRESASRVVGVLEAQELPSVDTVEWIAEQTRVTPENVRLVVARTNSLAGIIQVVARSVETALHKLHTLGFDLERVVSGRGSAPIPPVARNRSEAIGRTNDAILYGSSVTLSVRGDDASIEEIAPRVPSSASRDYGTRFETILARYENFYDIDPMLFSPARITFRNVETGSDLTAGELADDILAQSFSS